MTKQSEQTDNIKEMYTQRGTSTYKDKTRWRDVMCDTLSVWQMQLDQIKGCHKVGVNISYRSDNIL